jgi:alanyl-tRNA synthetase
MKSVNDIRSNFIGFFEQEGHTHVSSGPLVPRNDPTLMFTNAGMVQFKNVFTGLETRAYSTAVTSQKCVRAGGKHNDLDNVGFTARHLTFFEMLGNFSFGNYFKERAIDLAWRLVHKELGLNRDRLLVTVYHDDDEAFDLWRRVAGLGEDRIIRIASNANYWSMGDTGPCGPCSEIFYDHGEAFWGGPPGSKDEDGDRFIEIWNLVFMQFEQLPDGRREPLPRPSIDTGMGLERMASVLQGTNSVFETDLFKMLVDTGAAATGVMAQGDGLTSLRVIADHLRSMAFLIAEGVLPSNEGRGYVLRRIMRRAMRHATLLGAKKPVIHTMVPALVGEMGQAFPELLRGQDMIGETIELEEARFLRTLGRGLQILADETRDFQKGETLDGATAFKLYDTYGFPLDLTEDALKAREIGVDTAGFEAAMARQKAEARKNWTGSGAAASDEVWFKIAEQTGATEFLGYETEHAEAEVVALVSDGQMVDRLASGEKGFVIVNQTPFYGESGGQVGDSGTLRGDNVKAEILDTGRQFGGIFAHLVEVETGEIEPGQAVSLWVDHGRRTAIRANHSATHLLHAALRRVLGTHVTQKGSLVSPDRLRFDFSHTKPVSADELDKIEELANTMVLQDSAVQTRLMGVDEARAAGAMALFGEKYGEEVRVVTMGRAENDEPTDKPWSMELCGGTHVHRTGEIGLTNIVQETSVAAGVRRIEALTGHGARRYLRAQEARLFEAAAALKVAPAELPKRVTSLVEERRDLERRLSEARQKLALGGGGGASAAAGPETVAGVAFVGRVVEGLAPRDLRGMVDEAKKQIGSGVAAVIGVTEDGKAGVAVGVTGDLVDRFSAVDLVRAASGVLGGKGGGGRADMAQAGGPDGKKADGALAAIRTAMSS